MSLLLHEPDAIVVVLAEQHFAAGNHAVGAVKGHDRIGLGVVGMSVDGKFLDGEVVDL